MTPEETGLFDNPLEQFILGLLLLLIVLIVRKWLRFHWKKHLKEEEKKLAETRKIAWQKQHGERARNYRSFSKALKRRPNLKHLIGGITKQQKNGLTYWLQWYTDEGLIKGSIEKDCEVIKKWEMTLNDFNKLGNFWERHDIEAEKIFGLN